MHGFGILLPLSLTRQRSGTARRIVDDRSSRDNASIVVHQPSMLRLTSGFPLFVAALLTTAARPQDGWTRHSLTVEPAPRSGAAMVFDPGQAQVIMFGGESQGTTLDETWRWDGSRWQDMWWIARPSGRFGVSLVHDVVRREVLMFGGQTGTGVTNETWAFDGISWVQRRPMHLPPGVCVTGGVDARAPNFVRERSAEPSSWTR